MLVHDSASMLVEFTESLSPGLIDQALLLFGASIHDIGKAVHLAELVGSGAEHETAGLKLLADAGVGPDQRRFARTHAHWQEEGATLEDLAVALADKVWKGKREDELELVIAHRLASESGLDRWDVYAQLGEKLDLWVQDAPRRLAWQARFGPQPPSRGLAEDWGEDR
ncbi:MAG: HD domain-containing protein [Phycisphaerales bacterium JB063]